MAVTTTKPDVDYWWLIQKISERTAMDGVQPRYAYLNTHHRDSLQKCLENKMGYLDRNTGTGWVLTVPTGKIEVVFDRRVMIGLMYLSRDPLVQPVTVR
jgi:hypothetical protein